MVLAAASESLNKTFAVLALVAFALVALALLVALIDVFARAIIVELRWLLGEAATWLAFLVAAIATGGSLYFSQIAGYVPCELCWFQRICMYPLSITLLLMAFCGDRRAVRYLLPLPIVGVGVSLYHIAVENGWVAKPSACSLGAADCGTKWINEFGFVTIPTLALAAFALLILLMLAAAFPPHDEGGDEAPAKPKRSTPPRAAAPVPAKPLSPRPRREAKAEATSDRETADVR